jgi:hypothetical protein
MAIVDGSLQLGYKNTAWFTANASLVLLVGQIVYLEQTGTYKLGDGTTQLSALTFLGGGGTVDVNTIGTAINGATSATPNDTDLVMSVESSVAKKNTWTQIKSFLKTYFDNLFVKKGTLTTNYIQKATSSDTIGDSIIKENATGIDIGVTTLAGATAKLHLESDGTNPAFKTQSSIGVENFIIKEDGKINTPLLTPSQSVETDANKNLVSVTHYTESFAYTGSPFTLTVSPNYIFSIRTTSMVLDESDVNDVTIVGTTLTVINPAFQAGETLYIKYKG